MGRPRRTDFAGAIHHVIARCNNGEPWAFDDHDRRVLRRILHDTAERFEWRGLAYCLMSNHYHLLVQAPGANLSAGMHRLNRSFAGWFNHVHERVGHLFQDRYIAILIEDPSHLVRAFRYVLRNPVTARLVDDPADWRWSTARAVVGREQPPRWIDWAPVVDVLGGPDRVLPFLYLGDDDGLAMHELHHANTRPPLEALHLRLDDVAGIARAHYLHQHRVLDIAEHLGCSDRTIYRRLDAHADRMQGLGGESGAGLGA